MLDGSFYKEDALLPVYSYTPEASDLEGIVRILLLNYSPGCLCFSQPVNVAHNVSFLVDTRNSINIKTISNVTIWGLGNGTPKRLVRVSTDDEGKLSIKIIKENLEHDTNVYLVTRTCFGNCSSSNVRKIISTLESKLLYEQIPIYSLLILGSLWYLNRLSRSVVRMLLGQGKISQDWV